MTLPLDLANRKALRAYHDLGKAWYTRFWANLKKQPPRHKERTDDQ